jgi:hypothetical protein
MRSATAIATLCSLLSFVLTAPAPSHTRTLSIQAVNIKDEVYLASSPSQMTICSQDGKGTMLGWVYGYASSTIGEERVRWILVTLGTSVPSCDCMIIIIELL